MLLAAPPVRLAMPMPESVRFMPSGVENAVFERLMVARFLVATTVSDPPPVRVPVPVQPVTVNVLLLARRRGWPRRCPRS